MNDRSAVTLTLEGEEDARVRSLMVGMLPAFVAISRPCRSAIDDPGRH